MPESGELTGLACGVVTLGPALERRVTSLFAEKCYSLALALDDIGNQLLLAATRQAQDRMWAAARAQNLTMAGELRPGDPGLALQTQGLVLRLADAASIGVEVNRGHALTPLKSISMVLGVGVDLPPARWSRCDDCPSRATCRVANCPAQPAADAGGRAQPGERQCADIRRRIAPEPPRALAFPQLDRCIDDAAGRDHLPLRAPQRRCASSAPAAAAAIAEPAPCC